MLFSDQRAMHSTTLRPPQAQAGVPPPSTIAATTTTLPSLDALLLGSSLTAPHPCQPISTHAGLTF
jgi:hypothetical protein